MENVVVNITELIENVVVIVQDPDGGGGSPGIADGVTIEGDGTFANPYRVIGDELFVDEATILGDGTELDPYRVAPVRVKFYTTINAASFNVLEVMHDKFVIVDFPTTVAATILDAELLEGGIVTFHQKGAGAIEFVVEDALTQTILHGIAKSSEASRTVQLLRLPDVGGVKQYLVMGGVV
jgi:hypothetical protein